MSNRSKKKSLNRTNALQNNRLVVIFIRSFCLIFYNWAYFTAKDGMIRFKSPVIVLILELGRLFPKYV